MQGKGARRGRQARSFRPAEQPALQQLAGFRDQLHAEGKLGMGKGPKLTLQLVNYSLESRPLTDPHPRSHQKCTKIDQKHLK